MEKILIEFIDTLDLSLKKLQQDMGSASGVAKLTVSQLQYIDAVHKLKEPSLTEVADKLAVTKASVTAGVNKLAKLGYLIKTQSNEDKRVFHVSLTEEGEALIRAKYQALRDYGVFIRSVLTKDEAGQFEETLSKLVELFKKP